MAKGLIAKAVYAALFCFLAFCPHTFAKVTNDPYVGKQWWIYSNGRNAAVGSDINIIPFWLEEERSWPDISIGIIDTGINARHADLAGRIKNGYDFITKTARQDEVMDKDGHGSFIAGLIAARTNNKKGIAGLSHKGNLRVVSFRFNFETTQAVKAVERAKKRGIRVLNMSWGTEEYDQTLYDAIKDYNGIVVTAAGNEGKSHDTERHYYPCDFDLENIICVGASSESGTIASYSDYGSAVDLLAPGGEDKPLYSIKKTNDNKYTSRTGTSYATAFVSGTVGLMLSKNPALDSSQVKDIITSQVRRKDTLQGKVGSGGILNVSAALSQVSH